MKQKENIDTELLNQLANESSTAIYVGDCETDELLYINKTGADMLGVNVEDITGQKCYKFLMNLDSHCPFCHKELFCENKCTDNTLTYPNNHRHYRIRSKLLHWRNRLVHVHYITDETELLIQQKKLRTLTDHIPTGIGIHEVYSDGRVEAIYLNDGYYQMMGSTREKRTNYSGFALFNAVHPDDLDTISKAVMHTYKTNKQLYVEIRIINDNNEYIWVSIRGEVYQRYDNHITLYCVFSDINEIKRTQESLQQRYNEQVQYNKLISNNSVASFIINLKNNLITLQSTNNAKLLTNIKSNKPVIVLKYIAQNIPDEKLRQEFLNTFNLQLIKEKYDSGISKGKIIHPLLNYETWIESSYNVVANPKTDDLEIYCFANDVSEVHRQKDIAEALMKGEYEDVILINANTGQPIAINYTSDSNIFREQEYANDYNIGLKVYFLKYSADSNPEDAAYKASLEKVTTELEKTNHYSISYSIYNNQQKIIRKQATYSYLDQYKTYILCKIQDITQSFKNEVKQRDELQRALKQANIANQAKEEFFAKMSHDMRTPLNGILGSVNLAIDEEEHTPKMNEYLHDIQFSGNFLLNLINDILDMSKIESGAMKLYPDVYTYFEFIDNMNKMIIPLCKRKNITLNMNPLKDNIAIKVDILRFQQLFFNIFSNAVKYTPEGGTIDHLTEIEIIDDNHIDCKCHIIDNGIGMSQEFLSHIFDPYTQERPNNNETQGTGLGLCIANQLARLMGGEINIKSELGQGTEVIIHTVLETVDLKDLKSLPSNNLKLIDNHLLEGCRILLCEDHPLNAKIAINILEKWGVNTSYANNGEEGVKMFSDSAQGYYDLILMDIRMPKLNGLDATKVIRRMNRTDAKSIPIVAMTANAYDSDIKKSLNAGMNDHLAKPIDSMKMYETIVKQISSKKR